MPKVYYTLPLGPGNIIDGREWEQLDNGWYLSPELTEAEAAYYLSISVFKEVKMPKPATSTEVKKSAARKTTAKPKGGA
ncbi:hypothetical protein IFY47_003322 [Salmonella enterica]|nr:hypothetical protein [Salmonella enterica]